MSRRLVLVALVAVACSNGPQAGPKGRPPPLVIVEKASSRDVPLEVSSSAELKPLAQADLLSKVVGYLDRVAVERGDRVRAGQLLATVRPSDLPDQLAATEGALAQTRTAVALTRSNAERAETLFAAGRISKQELDQARAAAAQAEAQEGTVKAQSAAVTTRLGETRLVAPFDGVVMMRRLDPGVLVGPGTTSGAIVTLARTDALRAAMTLTERDAVRVTTGMEAAFDFDAFPGRGFAGRVTRLAPAFDPVTRTLEVEVRMPNSSGELRPGLYGRGVVTTGMHTGAVTVPVSAVQLVKEKRFVFLLEGEKVKRQAVEVGVDHENWLEITRGVSAGQEVVVAGVDGLSDGMAVRVARGVDPFTGQGAPGGAAIPAK